MTRPPAVEHAVHIVQLGPTVAALRSNAPANCSLMTMSLQYFKI
jgi:hypothetical protein